MRTDTIRIVESRDTVAITIDRPQQQNAINAELLKEMHAALDRAEAKPECRIIVLRGAGGFFCTGLDFEAVTHARDLETVRSSPGGEAFLELLKRLTLIPRIVVSLVDGRASAGGVGLVAASDFVVASERSQFSLPEGLWGLLPCCVLPFLVRRVGFRSAYAMTITTLPITADDARATGLVDEVSSEPELTLPKFAFRFGKLTPETVRNVKAFFAKMWPLSKEMEQIALDEFGRLLSSPAVMANIASFVATRRFPWER